EAPTLLLAASESESASASAALADPRGWVSKDAPAAELVAAVERLLTWHREAAAGSLAVALVGLLVVVLAALLLYLAWIAIACAGAAGYLLKDESKDELLDAIRQVATGGAFIESQMLKGMLSEMKPGAATPSAARNLTKREREILALVAEGLSNREIADRLVLSPETVKSHVAAILEKLNVSDRTQAAIYAVRNGLVEQPAT